MSDRPSSSRGGRGGFSRGGGRGGGASNRSRDSSSVPSFSRGGGRGGRGGGNVRDRSGRDATSIEKLFQKNTRYDHRIGQFNATHTEQQTREGRKGR